MTSRSAFLLTAAAAVLLVTIRFGAFVAGGADSSGYLSQARLWERGNLVVDEPLIRKAEWPFADWTFSPLGFRPGLEKGTIVPIYSVGYPMVMALARKLVSPGSEMFIVPLAAAGVVVCTAILGMWAGGVTAGALAALLVATSPPFVLQSLQPMSDVPTALWWTLATVLALRSGLVPLIGMALAVMLAVLTRPNLAPLALPLILFALRPRAEGDQRNWQAAAAVVVGAGLGAAIVAYINFKLYGSPARSGYGTAGDLYQLNFGPLNLVRYTAWLVQTETMLVLVSFAAVLIAIRKRATQPFGIFTLAVGALLALSYIFYLPFDNWTYLRFFLPAYPLVFVALASLPVRRAVVVAIAGLVIAGHVKFVVDHEVFKTKAWEQKYIRVTDYLNRSLPANAIFIGHQYTGTIRYYTDREVLRYDWLPSNRLDDAVQSLQTLGYKPYFLLEDWEEPSFQRRFAEYSELSKLDWYPSVEFKDNKVRIYDPAKRPTK